MRIFTRDRCHRYLSGALVAIVLVGIVSLAGCGAGPANAPTPTQTPPAAPQRADLIGEIALAEIINDEDFVELYRQIASQNTTFPETLDAALDEVRHQTGIDLRDFSEITVFAEAATLLRDTESSPDSNDIPYWGALVEGEVEENAFIDNIEDRTGQKATRSTYQNYTIYVLTLPYEEGSSLALAFPADSQMIMGTTSAVKDALDVTLGIKEPVSGPVWNIYSKLGDAPLKAASRVPEALIEQIPEEMPVGPFSVSLLSFRDINCVALVLSKAGDLVSAEAQLAFGGEASAGESYRLLSMGSRMARFAVSDPTVKELLSSVHMSRSGPSIYLLLDMTTSEIARLFSAR